MSPSRYCCVPLNIMCSRRWDTPVIPVCSFRDPTRYQTLKLTTGAFRTSFTRTVRPFGSTVSWTPAVGVAAGAGDTAAGAVPPAVASRPRTARKAARRAAQRRARLRRGGLTAHSIGPVAMRAEAAHRPDRWRRGILWGAAAPARPALPTPEPRGQEDQGAMSTQEASRPAPTLGLGPDEIAVRYAALQA